MALAELVCKAVAGRCLATHLGRVVDPQMADSGAITDRDLVEVSTSADADTDSFICFSLWINCSSLECDTVTILIIRL